MAFGLILISDVGASLDFGGFSGGVASDTHQQYLSGSLQRVYTSKSLLRHGLQLTGTDHVVHGIAFDLVL